MGRTAYVPTYAPGTEPLGRGKTTAQHRLTPQAQRVPDDPIALLPAWTPCATCGQAAPTPTPTNGRARVEVVRGQSQAPSDLRVATLVLTRCDECQQVRRLAEAVVAAHPGLVAQRGPELAVEGVEAVLVALALLDRPALAPEVTGPDLGLHLRHLERAGSTMTWEGRALAGRCNPYPYAHVRLGERRRLRGAMAGLLRERVAVLAPPVQVVPPPVLWDGVNAPAWARGCLFCGVGHLSLSAAEVQRRGGRALAARGLWEPVLTSVSALDGRPSPAHVDGYLCPPCAAAVQEGGAVGPSSLSSALLTAWASSDDPALRDRAERLTATVDLDARPVGWGALAARDSERVPNVQPWGHVLPNAAPSHVIGSGNRT